NLRHEFRLDSSALFGRRALVSAVGRSCLPVHVRTGQDRLLPSLSFSTLYWPHLSRLRLHPRDAPDSAWPLRDRVHAQSTFPARNSFPVVCLSTVQRDRYARRYTSAKRFARAVHLRVVCDRAFILDL